MLVVRFIVQVIGVITIDKQVPATSDTVLGRDQGSVLADSLSVFLVQLGLVDLFWCPLFVLP